MFSHLKLNIVSAATASQEAKWLIMLLEELDLPQLLPINIYEDNQEVIKLAESEKYHSYIKHVAIKLYLIKHLCRTGIIKLNCLPRKDMTTDVVTKPLPKPSFTIHQKGLHVENDIQLMPQEEDC